MSADATAQVQPKALLPEEPVLPPPAPASPASQVDDIVASLYLLKAGPVKFCLQSCAWTSTHPDTLNPEVSLCPLHPILFLCSKPPIHPSAVVFGFRF